MTLDLGLVLPELTIIALVAFFALIEITLPDFSRRYLLPLNFLGMSAVALTLLFASQRFGTAFDRMFIADPFALFFKFIFLTTAAVVLAMKNSAPQAEQTPEFHLILWSALLGMFFLVSSGNFLLLFISLELMTLSLYILAAYTQRELASIEAGLKYLVLGSLASAFLLYGISLIYASAGTLSFEDLNVILIQSMHESEKLPTLLLIGILFVLSALGFKVASVPFQVWVPDVYQGAPTPVVAFFSVASKAAGFAVLLRLFIGTWGLLDEERRILFSLLGSLTLLYGNLAALVQKNVKRLLGYSSIGHAGFLLIALATGGETGAASLLYYLIAYAVSNLTVFLVLALVEQTEKSHELEAYRGLWRRSPLLAAALFLGLLSLAGVPPLAGFFAKFFVLLQAARADLIGLVFLGAVNVAISLYYYLNVIRTIYFEKPAVETSLSVDISYRFLLYGLITSILVVGFWQTPFLAFAKVAANSLF